MTDTRAPVELVKEWIAALRGGKYKQARGRLRDSVKKDPSFCCLGVVCDILDPEGWVVDGMGVLRWDGSWAGVDLHRFGISESECAYLAQLNDENQKSFDEIADYIESVILPQVVAASEAGSAPPVER